MDAGHVMMVMIVGGIALCGIHFRAQYTDWRRRQTAELERVIRVRELYRDHWAPCEDGREALRQSGSRVRDSLPFARLAVESERLYASTPTVVSKIWAVVLAGGEGRRLRSLTMTPEGLAVPKQYCSLQGGASLLEETLRRAEAVAERRQMLTVVAAQHSRWWKAPLRSVPCDNIIVQPENKGTALGLLLALLHIVQRDRNATLVVLPADHYVRKETVLARALLEAARLACVNRDRVYLLGLTPEEIDPELGYVVPEDRASLDATCVQRFVEKPPVEIARGLVQAGALWNAFILAASATALVRLYAGRYPGLVAQMTRAVSRDSACPQDATAARAIYSKLPTLDFSRDLLEGQESMLRVVVVPPCGWTDLGTPRRLAEVLRGLDHPSGPAPDAITTAHLSLASQHSRHRYPSGAAPLNAEAASMWHSVN
jgi:mannose-1-phosphate guanylyltransferase